MKQKILVTGATGFIGNYLVQQLLNTNCNVITTSADEEKAKQQSWFGSVRYIPLNFKNIAPELNYYDFFERPDRMIHLAWEGLPNYKSLFHIDENLPRHFVFLKNMITNGLPDLTVTGTCLEYGFQEGSLSEEMPSSPSNCYAVAKDSLRRFLEEVNKLYSFAFSLDTLVLYLWERTNPNSLLSQLDNSVRNGEPVFNMSGGEQVRDYLPVEEVASIIIRTAMQKQVTGIINCCSGKPVTIKQFVEDYCKENQLSIRLNPGYYSYTDYEPMYFWGDRMKLDKAMGN